MIVASLEGFQGSEILEKEPKSSIFGFLGWGDQGPYVFVVVPYKWAISPIDIGK